MPTAALWAEPLSPGGAKPTDTAGAQVAGRELPAELLAVVSRWNPQGMALLRAMNTESDGAAVLLIGPDDANTTLLRTELARFEPRVPLGNPVLEPALAVQTTAPPGADAAVALVLLDAGTTLGADDLAMLRRLRGDGIRVLLAMNGTHAHQDWRAVRDHDLALLAADGAGDLDIVPVSARLAAAARNSGDSALLDSSGLGLLHAALIAAIGTADSKESRRAVVATRVVDETRKRITEQVAVLRSGAEAAQLREERAKLLAGRDGGQATAMSTLRGQLHLARVDLMTAVGGHVRGLHTVARAELDRLDRSELGDYPDRLQQAVAELTVAVDDEIERRLVELATRVGRPPEETGPVRRDSAPRVGPDPEARPRGVEDHLMIALGASAGVGLGRLVVSPLALVPALDVASVPVALLLGAGVAAWVVRARGQLADRNHLRQWVADALANVKAELEQRAATALVEAETMLADRLVRAGAEHRVEADRKAAELETRIRRIAAEQPGRLAACQRDMATIDHWLPAGVQ